MKRKAGIWATATLLVMGAVSAQVAWTQQSQPSPVTGINVLPVRGNIYMLIGAGGNIGMSVGRDGILLVDTGTAQMSDKLLATVQQLAYSVIAGPTPATTCVGP